MDRPSPHHPIFESAPGCTYVGHAAKRAVHAKRRLLVSASIESQTDQLGQKPFGVAKNSKIETFRRCRI
jgi:hypothetical protein